MESQAFQEMLKFLETNSIEREERKIERDCGGCVGSS
jgi:hypothetical protein